MLSITKLRNLKAIHNKIVPLRSSTKVVINRKTTKFESNSQPLCTLCVSNFVVINHKTTKFESNSQPPRCTAPYSQSCYQSQNYKIWKQFTTSFYSFYFLLQLLSITKLQNLKAIHNKRSRKNQWCHVVINHKTTKFESNSQQVMLTNERCFCCY